MRTDSNTLWGHLRLNQERFGEKLLKSSPNMSMLLQALGCDMALDTGFNVYVRRTLVFLTVLDV